MATAAATATATRPKAPESRMALVKKGRMSTPIRVLVFGGEGIGKTTLAASAPDPIFFDIEDGSGRLDAARYPFRDGPGGHVPHVYSEVTAGIEDLATSEHPYQTLVIDTADRLESLIWRHMLDRDSGTSSVKGKKLNSIEEYGFGKGYQMAVDEWRSLCVRLDRLRMAKGMGIIVLAHSQIRTFKNPAGDDYDRYSLRVNERAAGFLKEWSDVTAFACFEEGGGKLDPDARAKGWSTGRRLLKLERAAAYDAKTRIPLPKEVELDPMAPWAPFAAALDEGMNLDPKQLVELIGVEVKRIGDDELATEVAAAVAGAKTDTQTLTRYLINLKQRQPKEEAQSNE